MIRSTLLLALPTAVLALSACDKAADPAAPAATAATADADSKLSAAVPADSRFGKALAAAGMTAVLDAPGPYTLLLPADEAFDKLPAGAETTLLEKDGKDELVRVLGTQVLPGTILAEDIAKAIEQGGGKASLPTMSGALLTATRDGDAIVLSDSAGAKARLGATDERHANGVVHRVDTLLMPAAT